MSQPVGQPGPVETMMASDAASRLFGIELSTTARAGPAPG